MNDSRLPAINVVSRIRCPSSLRVDVPFSVANALARIAQRKEPSVKFQTDPSWTTAFSKKQERALTVNGGELRPALQP